VSAAVPIQQVHRFARIWREKGRKKNPWYAQATFLDGSYAEMSHWFPTKKEALDCARRLDDRFSGERDRRDRTPVVPSSDLIDRPSRTPFFYRKQAIVWSREARRARHGYGILDLAVCLRLAKSYLKSYHDSRKVWQKRFGV